MANLAFVLQQRQEWPRAFSLFEELLVTRQRLHGPHHPHVLSTMNDLARLLLTVPKESIRDVERGWKLAKKCHEIFPESGRFTFTLGLAEFRAKNYSKVIETVSPKRDRPNLKADGVDFLLAICHFQLNDEAAALADYKMGIKVSDAGKMSTLGLDLKHEADQLFGPIANAGNSATPQH